MIRRMLGKDQSRYFQRPNKLLCLKTWRNPSLLQPNSTRRNIPKKPPTLEPETLKAKKPKTKALFEEPSQNPEVIVKDVPSEIEETINSRQSVLDVRPLKRSVSVILHTN